MCINLNYRSNSLGEGWYCFEKCRTILQPTLFLEFLVFVCTFLSVLLAVSLSDLCAVKLASNLRRRAARSLTTVSSVWILAVCITTERFTVNINAVTSTTKIAAIRIANEIKLQHRARGFSFLSMAMSVLLEASITDIVFVRARCLIY